MSDIAISRYLLKTANKNVIINPYKFGGFGSTLVNGLVNWWDLLGNANDSVGGANLTTSESFNGTAPSGDTNCINFDGTGGAEIGSGAVTSPTKSEITIGGWFEVTNTAGRSLWYFGAENSLVFVTNRFTHRVGSTNISGPVTLAANTWYSYVFTANASGWNAYVNDSTYDSGTDVFDFTPANEIFDLGARASTDFIGPMAGWAIWDRILTASEITEFYNGGVNLKYSDL